MEYRKIRRQGRDDQPDGTKSVSDDPRSLWSESGNFIDIILSEDVPLCS